MLNLFRQKFASPCKYGRTREEIKSVAVESGSKDVVQGLNRGR